MYNVILVDDEVRTIDALEKNIDWKKCGIRKVFKASSMNQAIPTISDEKIEILVSDIEMPNGTGLQLLEWMRDHDRLINCIFLTCHPEFAYMRKAIQLNCYDYVLKPIDYEEFQNLLSELVHKMEDRQTADSQKNENGKQPMPEVTESVLLERKPEGSEQNMELEVKKYIKDHMSDSISVANIADELHFNPQYLMRSFKNKTGLSIVEYITQERLNTAKRILKKTDLPVKAVSSMVGYEDYAYFTRVFKKETGESPTTYRSNRR